MHDSKQTIENERKKKYDASKNKKEKPDCPVYTDKNDVPEILTLSTKMNMRFRCSTIQTPSCILHTVNAF